MDTLHEALGIAHLLESANRLARGWGIEHRDLGLLGSVAEFEQASRTGEVVDRDDVLLGLAREAHVEAGDCPEAAALLCHLLIPGTLAKLRMHKPGSLPMSALCDSAAQHLWMGARTFPWETRRKVAASIQWQVRRATFADLGVQAKNRGDRVWSHTQTVEDSALEWLLLNGDPGDVHEEAETQLAAVLAEACALGLVDRDDLHLLLTVVEVAHHVPMGRVGVHGLMSRDASAEVGARLGISASSARRRLARVLQSLQSGERAGLLLDVA